MSEWLWPEVPVILLGLLAGFAGAREAVNLAARMVPRSKRVFWRPIFGGVYVVGVFFLTALALWASHSEREKAATQSELQRERGDWLGNAQLRSQSYLAEGSQWRAEADSLLPAAKTPKRQALLLANELLSFAAARNALQPAFPEAHDKPSFIRFMTAIAEWDEATYRDYTHTYSHRVLAMKHALVKRGVVIDRTTSAILDGEMIGSATYHQIPGDVARIGTTIAALANRLP